MNVGLHCKKRILEIIVGTYCMLGISVGVACYEKTANQKEREMLVLCGC